MLRMGEPGIERYCERGLCGMSIGPCDTYQETERGDVYHPECLQAEEAMREEHRQRVRVGNGETVTLWMQDAAELVAAVDLLLEENRKRVLLSLSDCARLSLTRERVLKSMAKTRKAPDGGK